MIVDNPFAMRFVGFVSPADELAQPRGRSAYLGSGFAAGDVEGATDFGGPFPHGR
jgi:hypothetical protein